MKDLFLLITLALCNNLATPTARSRTESEVVTWRTTLHSLSNVMIMISFRTHLYASFKTFQLGSKTFQLTNKDFRPTGSKIYGCIMKSVGTTAHKGKRAFVCNAKSFVINYFIFEIKKILSKNFFFYYNIISFALKHNMFDCIKKRHKSNSIHFNIVVKCVWVKKK